MNEKTAHMGQAVSRSIPGLCLLLEWAAVLQMLEPDVDQTVTSALCFTSFKVAHTCRNTHRDTLTYTNTHVVRSRGVFSSVNTPAVFLMCSHSNAVMVPNHSVSPLLFFNSYWGIPLFATLVTNSEVWLTYRHKQFRILFWGSSRRAGKTATSLSG